MCRSTSKTLPAARFALYLNDNTHFRVINFTIGDEARMFERVMSPWARAIRLALVPLIHSVHRQRWQLS